MPIVRARELNAAEEEVGPFNIGGGGNRGGGAGAGAAARRGRAAPTAPAPGPTTFTHRFEAVSAAHDRAETADGVGSRCDGPGVCGAQAAAAQAAGRAGGRRRRSRRCGANALPNVPKPSQQPSASIALPFNLDGMSLDAARADGDFDGKKHTIAGELLPGSRST